MKPPKVTVVTPSLNQGRFIERTITSVLNQDYPNLEYIVIDGGSTDETLSILRRYENQFKWVSEPDRGQSHAINKGWKMSSGDILAYLNSDDTYKPGAVAGAVRYFLEDPELLMIYGRMDDVDENDRIIRPSLSSAFDLKRLMRDYDYFLPQPASFFRREALDKVGFLDESLHFKMDREFFIRIGMIGKVKKVPECLATSRLHSDQKSKSRRNAWPMCKEFIRIRARYGGRFSSRFYVKYVYLSVKQMALSKIVMRSRLAKELIVAIRERHLDHERKELEEMKHSSGDFIRALFLFPYSTIGISRRITWELWKNGKAPDTLLFGMNHLERYGIRCDFLDPGVMGALGNFLRRIDHAARNNISQQIRAAFAARKYDVLLCKDLPTSVLLLLLKRLGLVRAPVILLDPVITERTPMPALVGWGLKSADRIVYLARPVRDILTSRFCVRDSALTFIPFGVDVEFFRPQVSEIAETVVSVGSNDRDYEVLIRAAQELGLSVCITASELRESGRLGKVEVLKGIDHLQLRELYASSALVAVPMVDVPSPSGVTALLEGMAMGKAVVVTRNRGLRDYVVDGYNAAYVEPGDVRDMREKLRLLMSDRDRRQRLGENGRRCVEEEFNTARLASRLAEVIKSTVR